MTAIERWTLYIGEDGTHGIWVERGEHPGWKGKLRGKFRRVVVVPEDQLTGAVSRLERVGKLAAWIERDKRESDKVLMYAQELAQLAVGYGER